MYTIYYTTPITDKITSILNDFICNIDDIDVITFQIEGTITGKYRPATREQPAEYTECQVDVIREIVIETISGKETSFPITEYYSKKLLNCFTKVDLQVIEALLFEEQENNYQEQLHDYFHTL